MAGHTGRRILGPFTKVNRWDDGTLAGHSRIAERMKEKTKKLKSLFKILPHPYHSHFMIWQHHRINLDGVNQVRVIANDARQLGLAHLLQLLGRKGRRLIGQFVPEAIASSQVAHLCGDDTAESRSQHGARQRLLRHTTRPQVNVRRMSGINSIN